MRYLLAYLRICVLGGMSLGGCSEVIGVDGQGGSGGSGTGGSGGGGALKEVFPCTEQGIRDAVAQGGGPLAFDCDEGQVVVTSAPIAIDRDVVLEGAGDLTVDGNDTHEVFRVGDATVALRGFSIVGAAQGSGIDNQGTLTLTNVTVSGNRRAGITNGSESSDGASLTMVSSTVSENLETGIVNWGTLTLFNSTVSGNLGLNTREPERNGGILGIGAVEIRSSTLSGNAVWDIVAEGLVVIQGSIVDGGCGVADGGEIASSGYNIESSGDSCSFDEVTDQSSVSESNLKLEPLEDNGGPTQTHALGEDSVAIGRIPATDCALREDQRGVDRVEDEFCDVGAFEATFLASCADTPHGVEETRDCFTASLVEPGESCFSFAQSRLCQDGIFDPDYPACDHLSCAVAVCTAGQLRCAAVGEVVQRCADDRLSWVDSETCPARCSGGACVECVSNSDCPDQKTCGGCFYAFPCERFGTRSCTTRRFECSSNACELDSQSTSSEICGGDPEGRPCFDGTTLGCCTAGGACVPNCL